MGTKMTAMADGTPTRGRHYEIWVLLLLTLANGVVAFDRLTVAYLAPYIVADLALSNAQLGLLAAALSGATSGIAVFAGFLEPFHELLHRHEIWILIVSAALVVAGGALEALARRGVHTHGFPWLFLVSVFSFLINVAIVVAHRAV